MHGCQKKPVIYRERHKDATPYVRKTKHREDFRNGMFTVSYKTFSY